MTCTCTYHCIGAYHCTYHSSRHFWDAHIISVGVRISLRWYPLKLRLVPVCTNWLIYFKSNFDYFKLSLIGQKVIIKRAKCYICCFIEFYSKIYNISKLKKNLETGNWEQRLITQNWNWENIVSRFWLVAFEMVLYANNQWNFFARFNLKNLTWKQNSSNHARHNDQVHGWYFENCCH